MSFLSERRAVLPVTAATGLSAVLPWIVRQRLHIAACATAGAWAWGVLLRVHPPVIDLVIVASVVFAIYQWNRLTDVSEDAINCPDELRDALASRRAIEAASMIAIALAVALTALSPAAIPRLVMLAVSLLLGFLYGTPLVRRLPASRLKSLFLIKNLSSAFGWSLLTVLFSVAGSRPLGDGVVLLAFGTMFSAVCVVELLWDLRDRAGDAAAHIHSLPVVLGVRATRAAILVVNAVPAMLVGYGVETRLLHPAWLFVLVNTVVVIGFVVAFDDFAGAQRRWTHVLVIIQTLLLLGLGVVAGLV